MPRLLIVRHAIAQDREEARLERCADAERPLTGKGQRRMQQAALGIRNEVGELEKILSSPLTRARQTAEILAVQYPDTPVTITEHLAPGRSLPSLLDELENCAPVNTLAVIGHEPELGQLLSLSLCGHTSGAFQLKKAGAALIDFPRRYTAGEGSLLWLLTPSQLRSAGRR